MKHGLQDIDWGYVGACLADTDEDNQTNFFKAFVKECKSWGTEYQVQKQLDGVNLKLTKEERDALKMLSYDEKEG